MLSRDDIEGGKIKAQRKTKKKMFAKGPVIKCFVI